MLLRFFFLVMLALPVFAPDARADQYADANWPNLVRTLVRFNAINLSDPLLIDEYAIVTECDLYSAFFHDDFKWNQVRQAVRQSVQNNIATYPMNYHYDVRLQLDRYDFDAKFYRFTEKSALRNINTFVLYSVEGKVCGYADIKFMPRTFRAVLSAPLFMDGLPLAEKDAHALLKQMNDDKNTSHIIDARFNLRIVYVDPLRKETVGSGGNQVTRYQQSNTSVTQTVRFDVRLDSIDFYEDPQMTRLIYQYQP